MFFTIVVIAVFGSAGVTFGVVRWLGRDLPSPESSPPISRPVKTLVYDAQGAGAARVLQGEPLAGAAEADSATSGERHDLHRGSELLPALGRGPVGRRPRGGPQRAADAHGRGRQHDHPAARPQSVPHARAHGHPQAQGDRARDRDRAQLFQEPDPRDVLQPDLLRRRRVRRRSRRQDLLRQARPGADARRVRVARRPAGESERSTRRGGAPRAARARRTKVLRNMLATKAITQVEFDNANGAAAGRHGAALQQRPRSLFRRDGPAPSRRDLRFERRVRRADSRSTPPSTWISSRRPNGPWNVS